MENTEEIWKTYPDYDFIEVSNLGRIRTKDRIITRKDGKKYSAGGQVLNQQIKKNGYMQVCVRVNGKKVYLLTHRMVAICFIPNPNDYPEVNHKDNDRTNNVVSNLEWCTHEYNIAYKERYGVSAREATKVLRHHVFAINLKTGKVLRFESQNEAARQLGVSRSSIYAVINGEQYVAGNYWVTEDESEITEEKIREIRVNMKLCPMIAVNPETFEVFWFESQCEAGRQLGVYQSNISDVINGKRNKTCGHWFCYADKNVVEKTRKNFGNDIAKKVEELMKQN
ncbi:HNH endonuclease [Lactobacillus phage Ldl1]|uniref:HNH endonuclease n=1 Tax=Lactobacillus phage Ldl1 TaxID=1552735 RepID=A0A0A7DMZ6_9CAUD|nr:HNH endonuclease [Lactobacillus phage Ldl1]AIS73894.1 HNH endonuclease [Lactobacillus phage Ldl1]